MALCLPCYDSDDSHGFWSCTPSVWRTPTFLGLALADATCVGFFYIAMIHAPRYVTGGEACGHTLATPCALVSTSARVRVKCACARACACVRASEYVCIVCVAYGARVRMHARTVPMAGGNGDDARGRARAAVGLPTIR